MRPAGGATRTAVPTRAEGLPMRARSISVPLSWVAERRPVVPVVSSSGTPSSFIESRWASMPLPRRDGIFWVGMPRFPAVQAGFLPRTSTSAPGPGLAGAAAPVETAAPRLARFCERLTRKKARPTTATAATLPTAMPMTIAVLIPSFAGGALGGAITTKGPLSSSSPSWPLSMSELSGRPSCWRKSLSSASKEPSRLLLGGAMSAMSSGLAPLAARAVALKLVSLLLPPSCGASTRDGREMSMSIA